jgi:hypothetical protein
VIFKNQAKLTTCNPAAPLFIKKNREARSVMANYKHPTKKPGRWFKS